MKNKIETSVTEQNGASILQALITLALVVMSFVLGYVVGGQRSAYRPQAANDQPASLEEILKHELAQQQGEPLKEKEFEFYKKLKEAKSAPAPVKRRSLPKPAVVKKAPEQPKPVVAPKAPKVEEVMAKAAPQQPAETVSEAIKLYTLQVGSFRTLESANRLLGDLKEKQVEGFISRAKIEGKGEWFRVRVGRFGGQEEAARAARDLQSQTGKSSLITKLELK